ncbi:MAG: peptidoglycan DD-metalloendopeptidase family protein [Lachnospiraceae bacterium]|nr:peptidoglycan DD-metalloendopeptidase family protein [Lachnospiraceae bacterium]
MKKKRFVVTGLLICLTLLLMGLWNASVLRSKAAKNNDSTILQNIKEKQEQISKAEKEKSGLKKNLSDVQSIQKNLESKKKDLNKYIAELDDQIALVDARMAELREEIVLKEAELAATQAEVEEAIARETGQMDNMIIRARQMYEKRSSLATELLTGVSGMGEFLNRAELMERLVTYDKEQWTMYQNYRKYVELCERQLELEKEILDQTKENVELEQSTLELFLEQKKRDIEAYEADISNNEKAIEEYEAMIRQQDEEIKALEAALAAERKKLTVQRTYDGGTFVFPLESYTRVSDPYGWRIHPILKVKQFHNGIDLASPKGTPMYAAYDGVVVAAAYSPTMGNYVMIDHGDNLYTVYMHASVLKVSEDTVVTRGQTIALVGSTGRSTGPHLHFSVRKDGEYVSPLDYITLP